MLVRRAEAYKARRGLVYSALRHRHNIDGAGAHIITYHYSVLHQKVGPNVGFISFLDGPGVGANIIWFHTESRAVMKTANIHPDTSAIFEKPIKQACRTHLFD